MILVFRFPGYPPAFFFILRDASGGPIFMSEIHGLRSLKCFLPRIDMVPPKLTAAARWGDSRTARDRRSPERILPVTHRTEFDHRQRPAPDGEGRERFRGFPQRAADGSLLQPHRHCGVGRPLAGR